MVIVCENCGYFYDSDFDSVCPGCKNAPSIPQGNPANPFDSFNSFAAPAAEPVKEPEQENYKMPMNEQFVPLTQEQYSPPVQEQFNTPMQEQFNPPVQEEYRMPMNEQFVPLTQEQYNPPVQEQFNTPMQEQFNPPVQPKYDAPVQAQFIPPVIPEADFNQVTAPVVKSENKKRCVSCGQEIPEANAFCRYCGAPQVKKEEAPPAPVYRCSSCSAEVSKPDSLCPDCEMRAAAPVQKPVAPLFIEDNLVFPSPADPVVPEPIIPEPIAEPIAPEPVPEPVIPEPFIPQAIVPEPAQESVSEPIQEPEPEPEYDFMSAPTIIVDPIVNKVVDEPFPVAENQIDEIEYPKTEAAPHIQQSAAKCPLCAKEIDNPDYLFCPYCGSSLTKKAAPEPVQIPVQPAAEPVISQPPVQQEAAPVYYPNLVPGQFMCENCGTVMNYGDKMCSNCFAPVSSMKGIAAVTNVNTAPADNSDIIPERNPLTAMDYDKMVVPDFFAGDDSQL